MEKRYRIILSKKNVYKELSAGPQDRILKAGTLKGCDLRLNQDLFFCDFELTFQNEGEAWQVFCSSNIYLTVDGLMKLSALELAHGDTFTVKYQASNQELLTVSFTIDFDFETKTYDRCIDLAGVPAVHIGAGQGCQIFIAEPLLEGDTITLRNDNGNYTLMDNQTTYGVYINGQRVQGSKKLCDYDFFSMMGHSFYLKYGKLYTAIDPKVRISGLSMTESIDSTSHLDYPKFNRSSRVQHIIPDYPVEIKQPPAKPEKPKKNVLTSLVPSLAMLAIIVMMRDSMGGGGSFILYSGGMMLVGVVMSVLTFITDGRQYKKDLAKREKEYLHYIEEKETEIQGIRDNELRVRREIHTSLDDSVKEVQNFGARLFEKDVRDKDFLEIYLGTGTLLAKCQAQSTNKPDFVDAEDPISQLPEKLEQKFRYITSAPVISTLGRDNVLGVVGRRDKLQDMLKNMTLDVAIRHFYKDVKLVYMFDESSGDQLSWVRWLGHVHNDQLDIRNLMCDEESNNLLLEYLYSLLSQREAAAKEQHGTQQEAHYVVFIFHQKEIAKHPISKYFEGAGSHGFTFVFFEEYEELLPKGCKEIIRLNEHDESATVLSTEDAEQQIPFSYETVKDVIAEAVALKLSPVCINEMTLESQLTKNITLFELLDMAEVGDLDLKNRWNTSRVYKNMAAPLGVKKKGEIVYLDISDKATAHGPHGLVAGTTGSGKSEILQSYVLSMASLFHPYDVGFLIIDFKGGGMANQFEDLPHLMGSITNIDGREINRSLRSIKAELIKRQELFAESGVNHINDYIQLFKEDKVSIPMPHLIMVVDEFAELKAEFPDFMDEVISAARIGRTLGVHLILATQKPSGVVNDQIWSNSKFKLCLKVQTKEDSSEVIKSPLAAEIVEPGRAYFQVGNNEIFELFQSAYSGAKVSGSNEEAIHTYEIYALNTWGKRQLVYTNKKAGEEKGRKNQLEVMVDYIRDYCDSEQITKLQGICLPSLEERLFANTLDFERRDSVNGIRIPVGIYDDPDQQRQGTYMVNLSDSNTFIIGTSQMGKTTLLQTMAYEMMLHYSPKEVSLYVIDCGNMALKPLEASNHVGGVAVSAEEEKVEKLLQMLSKEITRRKKLFLDKGLGTYKAYVEAGFDDLPQIVLMIDNMAAFRELFEPLENTVTMFSREGQSVGLNMVVTSSQTNGLGFRAIANFGTKIAFTCNDTGEYAALFDRCKMEPKETPGRGLCQIDKRIMEVQTALAFEGEKEIERVEAMRAFIQKTNGTYGDYAAKPIPQVGEVIFADQLFQQEINLFVVPYKIPYGISYREVEYQFMDLLTLGMLGVSGRAKSGKSNFVKYIITTLERIRTIAPSKVYILDSDMRQLESLAGLEVVDGYTTEPQVGLQRIKVMAEELESRQRLVIENRGTPAEEVLEKEPLLVFLTDRRDVLSLMEEDLDTKAYMDTILDEYGTLKILFIFSNVENAVFDPFNSPDVIKRLGKDGKVIAFEEIDKINLLNVDMLTMQSMKKEITPGDGFTNLSGEIEKVKTFLQT